MESLTIENVHFEAEKFIATIPPYPGGFDGRGIVICGGGLQYFTCAWVCINMLRRWGCDLPIQLWYLGSQEMTACMELLLKPLRVECIDGLEVRKKYPARILNGWELKAYAIIHSPFKEVMLLDADNVPIVDTTVLFDSIHFKKAGAIFWPDFGRLGIDHPIWSICGVAYRDEPEFETGQIVVDKERCWDALCLSMWYNEHSDFFYSYILGDKETFHLAFHKLNRPFAMIETPIDALEDTMCQHDFLGRRIFQHRNLDKWDLLIGNKYIAGFLFDEECHRYLQELRTLWNECWRRECFLRSRTDREYNVITQIIATSFDYHRIGYDVRPMKFLENGAVGQGAGGQEMFWDLKSTDDGSFIFEIYSHKEITCCLIESTDKVWRGPWLHNERMPIELIPTASK
jgi:hypothetical protein